MIKAIVFDCFGVLTSDGWLSFAKNSITDPTKQKQAHDLNRQANVGLITYDQFVDQVAALAGKPSDVVHTMLDSHVPNYELFSLMAALKQTYKIGMLSNAGADWLNELFTPDQVALFDATALSYEIGITKPYPQAYHAICDRLGIEPSEAVFVDDIERYATGAKDIGMHGIWFKNNDQLVTELNNLLK